MTKQELLKAIHALIWKDDDLMEQDTLFDLQELVDTEIISEAMGERLEISQYPNGLIKSIKVPELQEPASYFVGDCGHAFWLEKTGDGCELWACPMLLGGGLDLCHELPERDFDESLPEKRQKEIIDFLLTKEAFAD